MKMIWFDYEIRYGMNGLYACMHGHMGVSINGGTPKSSIFMGFSIVNHPFWGTPIFGNPHTVQFMWLPLASHREITQDKQHLLPEDLPERFYVAWLVGEVVIVNYPTTMSFSRCVI